MLLYLTVRMFPAVMIVIPLFITLRMVGLLDSSLGLGHVSTRWNHLVESSCSRNI